MDITAYRDEIKLKLTGYVLDIELDDATLDRIINSALREVQRYITDTRLITVPYKSCIDLSNPEHTNGEEIHVSSVARVYRAESVGGIRDSDDPAQMSLYQTVYGLGNMYNFQNAMSNYLAWNTLLRLRNTSSTDMQMRFDKSTNQLYINVSSGHPDKVTIEYVPRCDTVDDVQSDYWIDVLMKMSVALAKIVVGRVRTRYTQTNALWTMDGQTILDEGNTEYTNLVEYLQNNSNFCLPVD